MSKKKIAKKQSKEKPKAKSKKQRQLELEKCAIEISGMQTDVKSFIEKFKADVAKKKKYYLSFAQKLRKKKE